MERRAYGVLGGKVERIKASNVDPGWLAEKLVSAKIIGKIEEERAKKADVPEAQRRGKLVEMVQGNGRKGVFQTFVNILLDEPHLEWLGEELKGKVYNSVYRIEEGRIILWLKLHFGAYIRTHCVLYLTKL